jgi:hypothetical protein
MLQSTLTRGTRLAHNQRLIDRRKLRGKSRARAIVRVNAKRLGRQPPARDKPAMDYSLADDSFWGTDKDEGNPELDLELIQGPSIAHPPRTARRPRLAPPAVHRRRRRAGVRATPTAHVAHLGPSPSTVMGGSEF